MAKAGDIFNVILKTIDDVQKKNKASKTQETAHSNVFDLIKEKIGDLDAKVQNNRVKKGKSPVSILELIKNQILAAKNQNKKDPNTPTADSAIFDSIIKKVEQAPVRVASTGLKRIVENFHLDISNVDPTILKQVQQQYNTDLKKMDQQYAEAMHKLIQRYK